MSSRVCSLFSVAQIGPKDLAPLRGHLAMILGLPKPGIDGIAPVV
jgi:hypothetical protein